MDEKNEKVNPTDFILPEPVYSIYEVARPLKLSPNAVRRLFQDEEGVLRVGSRGSTKKRPHISLRIPESVVSRVLSRLAKTG